MKRFTIMLCLLASAAYGVDVRLGPISGLTWTGSGSTRVATWAAGAAVDPTLLFEWHCETNDVTLGTPAGYSVGATVGTVVNTPAWSTNAQDGTYSLYADGNNDRVNFTWTNSAATGILKIESGTIDFYFNPDTHAGTILFYLGSSGSDRLYATLDANRYVALNHVAGGTVRSARTKLSVWTSNTWYHAKCRWDTTAHGGNYIQVTCDTTNGEANAELGTGTSALGTWAGVNSGVLKIGDADGNNVKVRLDNIKVYNVWK